MLPCVDAAHWQLAHWRRPAIPALSASIFNPQPNPNQALSHVCHIHPSSHARCSIAGSATSSHWLFWRALLGAPTHPPITRLGKSSGRRPKFHECTECGHQRSGTLPLPSFPASPHPHQLASACRSSLPTCTFSHFHICPLVLYSQPVLKVAEELQANGRLQWPSNSGC
jgi:hypothetical protein